MKPFFLLILLTASAFGQAIILKHADIHRSATAPDGIAKKYLEGNVHLVMDTVDFYADTIEYREIEKKIRLRGNLKILTPGSKITANNGYFFPVYRKLDLYNDVIYRDASVLMKTELAYIYLKTGVMVSPGKIRVWRKEDNSYLEADSGRAHTRENSYFFNGNAWFIRTDEESDTLSIRADHFVLYNRADHLRMIATGNVHIVRDTLIADCHKAEFFEADGRILLTGEPTAKWSLSDLTGDTIAIHTDPETNRPRSLILLGQAEILSPLDSSRTRENYLSGKKIVAHFKDGQVNWLEAMDNAISHYYFEGEKESGLNKASADTIRLFLKEGAIDSVAIRGGVEGTYRPE